MIIKIIPRLWLTVFVVLLANENIRAQFYVDGATIFLENSSSVLYVEDMDFENTNSGTILNNGTIYLNQDFVNTGTQLIGTADPPAGGITNYNGTVIFQGSAQNISGISIFNDVELRNNTSATISAVGSMTIQGVLGVTTGSTLNTNSKLTIASGASLMHGTGTPNSFEGAVNGNVSVQRQGSSGASYNYWSSPVENQNVSVLGNSYYYVPGNAPDLTEQGLRAAWVASSGIMIKGKGYASQGRGLVTFAGTAGNAPTGSNIEIAIDKPLIASGDYNQWNLVGNPFPCALDAASFTSTNNLVIDGSIYLWDDDASGGSGWNAAADYLTWNNLGSVSGPNSNRAFDGHIASGQSFFVNKSNPGTDLVSFKNSMRGTENNAFFRLSAIQRLWISVVNSQNDYNETLIGFIADATDGVDWGYDAEKLNGNPNISLYTRINGMAYAIQGLPLLANDRIVELGLDAGVAGTHTISLKAIEHVDTSVVVILEDAELGVFQNLRINAHYTFSTGIVNDLDRFYLHFSAPFELASMDEGCEGNDGQIILNQPGSYTWDYIVTNAQGAVVETGTDLNGQITIDSVTSGNYTLALTDDDGYQITKSFTVNGKKQVASDFQSDKAVAYENEPVSFSDNSIGATDVAWDFGDGTYSNDRNITHRYSTAGIYTVQLTASNDDCYDLATQSIEVNKLSTGTVEISDVFVQINTDGRSITIEFTEPVNYIFEFQIWNVTGQLIKVRSGLNGNQGRYQFSVEDCAPGYYHLRLVSPEQQFVKPLMLGVN